MIRERIIYYTAIISFNYGLNVLCIHVQGAPGMSGEEGMPGRAGSRGIPGKMVHNLVQKMHTLSVYSV